VWRALHRVRADQSPHVLAAMLGAAHDPGEAMQAAEVGSAQPVLGFGWRRPDVQGSNWFELFASTSIAA